MKRGSNSDPLFEKLSKKTKEIIRTNEMEQKRYESRIERAVAHYKSLIPPLPSDFKKVCQIIETLIDANDESGMFSLEIFNNDVFNDTDLKIIEKWAKSDGLLISKQEIKNELGMNFINEILKEWIDAIVEEWNEMHPKIRACRYITKDLFITFNWN